MHSCMVYFKSIKKTLTAHHFHFILLLIFFCLNGYRSFFSIVSPIYFLPFFFAVITVFFVLFYLFRLHYKCAQKAGFTITYLLFIFLFFGNIEDAFALNEISVFLSEPKWFLPFLVVLSFFILYQIKKIREGHSFHIFLNLSLLTIIGYELLMFGFDAYQTSNHKSELVLTPISEKNKMPVYIVVLDEYAGDRVLQTDYQFNNVYFKDRMTRLGFGDIKQTKSNYPLTVYSIASLLNMDYLPESVLTKKYAYGYKYGLGAIRNNQLTDIFSHWGYDINNYSFFDMKEAPAFFSNRIWGGGIRPVTSRCMNVRLYKHFVAFADKNHFGWFQHFEINHNYKHIFDVLRLTTIREIDKGKPSFNYLHFMSPHKPFLFDSVGNKLDKEKLAAYDQNDLQQKAYIWSVKKLNQLIFEWSKSIINKHNGNVVILILSDHGPYLKKLKARSLDNLCLVYSPSGNYEAWYSGITNVNQGRILLNQIFNQNISLLKDTSFQLKTKDD